MTARPGAPPGMRTGPEGGFSGPDSGARQAVERDEQTVQQLCELALHLTVESAFHQVYEAGFRAGGDVAAGRIAMMLEAGPVDLAPLAEMSSSYRESVRRRRAGPCADRRCGSCSIRRAAVERNRARGWGDDFPGMEALRRRRTA